MNVGSLFSGIGGMDLGLERAGMTISWQVEIDDYARRVLTKHWPHIPKYGDIRAIDWGAVPRVDVLCGGFPCQDLSYAGKRAGLREGTRSGLWFEYVRAIRALRPRYVLVENVPGLLTNHALGRVLGDLAESGYDAEWDCIPASAVGANHRRDRVWLVAYSKSERPQSGCLRQWGICEERDNVYESSSSSEIVADAESEQGSPDDYRREPLIFGRKKQGQFRGSDSGTLWGCSWPSEPAVGRVAYGIPSRVDRLRGLGNAVVPQIVEAIGRMILAAEQPTR